MHNFTPLSFDFFYTLYTQYKEENVDRSSRAIVRHPSKVLLLVVVVVYKLRLSGLTVNAVRKQ
jgi:hypothetical protein